MVKNPQHEKIYVTGYYQVRRHSRVLYIPIDRVVCDIHDIRKGDVVKVTLWRVIKASRDEGESGEEIS